MYSDTDFWAGFTCISPVWLERCKFSISLSLSLSYLLATVVYYSPLRTMLIIGSNHLISQTGWNRCNLLVFVLAFCLRVQPPT